MLCPLCQKECIVTEQGQSDPYSLITCPTKVSDLSEEIKQPHFMARTGAWEMAVIPPFKLMTELKDPDSCSVIYKNMGDHYVDVDNFSRPCYRTLLVLPPIHLDLEGKLLERIKLILLLS